MYVISNILSFSPDINIPNFLYLFLNDPSTKYMTKQQNRHWKLLGQGNAFSNILFPYKNIAWPRNATFAR